MHKLATIFLAELRRMAALWWSYRLSVASGLLLHTIVFPILMVTFQNLAARHGAAYGPSQQAASLIGYLVWHWCMRTFAAVPRMVEEEAGVGTLEILFLSPLSPLSIVGLRTAVLCLRYGLETAVLGLVLALLLHLPLVLSPTALPVLLLTLLGACGVGLAVAGLALVHKSVGSVVGVVSFLALLVSGALAPLDGLGTLFQALKYFFPLTWGIALLRDLQSGLAVGPGFVIGLAGLALQTVGFLLLGLAVFRWGNGRCRLRGTVNIY